MQRIREVGPVVLIAAALCLGTRTVAADAAPTAAGASTAFTSPAPTDATVGGPTYAPTATSQSGGPVTFAVDPATTNASCSVSDGIVSFAHAGSCAIDAEDAGSGTSASQTFSVAPAGTATSLVVGATAATASVSATAPGGGTPSGTVVFSVGGRVLGSAQLSNGVATLTYTVPPNVTEAILASYQGDGDYTASSATVIANGPDIEPTFVAKPTIAARLTSAEPQNRRGWWHTAVRVRFICNGAGSRIVGGCPRPVLLTRSGADLKVTRTIRTVAGDRATVTLRGIKLDMTRPRVVIVGVRNHASIHGARPPVTCAAADPISGIRSCRVIATVKRSSTSETITYTATAVSWAGVSQRTTKTVYSSV